MTDPQPTVREARARLAALSRHRPSDDPGVVQARRALQVAKAASKTAEAAALLAGDAS